MPEVNKNLEPKNLESQYHYEPSPIGPIQEGEIPSELGPEGQPVVDSTAPSPAKILKSSKMPISDNPDISPDLTSRNVVSETVKKDILNSGIRQAEVSKVEKNPYLKTDAMKRAQNSLAKVSLTFQETENLARLTESTLAFEASKMGIENATVQKEIKEKEAEKERLQGFTHMTKAATNLSQIRSLTKSGKDVEAEYKEKYKSQLEEPGGIGAKVKGLEKDIADAKAAKIGVESGGDPNDPTVQQKLQAARDWPGPQDKLDALSTAKAELAKVEYEKRNEIRVKKDENMRLIQAKSETLTSSVDATTSFMKARKSEEQALMEQQSKITEQLMTILSQRKEDTKANREAYNRGIDQANQLFGAMPIKIFGGSA